MKSRWKIISLFIFTTHVGLAQTGTGIEALKNVVPPSPNASSLGKYVEWPVNLYTGVPNISVPLYELKGRSVSIPISLSYHAAGNKVGEIASWVGLGWSLQAGGVITRSIKGLPDETGYFLNAGNFPNPDNHNLGALSAPLYNSYIVSAANNTMDSQEDSYSFSAMGKSYRLLLKADGTVQTIPHSNVKFVSNPIVGTGAGTSSPNQWIVLLEDGTKLVFGGNSGFTETTNNERFATGDGGGVNFTSSWYLKSVISTTGETINFSYTSNYIEQDSYFSQSDFIKCKNSDYTGDVPNSSYQLVEYGPISSSVEVQQVSTLNLASIESDLARIDFITDTAQRIDLKGGKALSAIRIFSKSKNAYIIEYKLITSYSDVPGSYGSDLLQGSLNPDYFYHRLRLNGVQKNSPSDSFAVKENWSFDYNPIHLPSRRSYAQDHWGFYNGVLSNTNLLPVEYFTVPGAIAAQTSNSDWLNFFSSGANRNPDSASMQAEMLTAIHYPTGGYTSFAYEPNGYPTEEEQFSPEGIGFQKIIQYGQTINSPSSSATFTLTKPGYVTLNLSYHITPGIKQDQPGANVKASIVYPNGTKTNAITTSDSSAIFNIQTTGTFTFKVDVNADISGFGSNDNISYDASIVYAKSYGIQPVFKMTGGLRVKSITDNDNLHAQNYNTRYFQYADPLVINTIDSSLDYITVQQVQSYNESHGGEMAFFDKTIRNSSSRFALGSIQGGTTGYGTVTTLYGDNGQNGKTVSVFSSEADNYTDAAKIFPYPAPDSKDQRRGLLLNQKDYSATQQLLKEVSNSYAFVSKGSTIGYKAGYGIIMDPFYCLDPYRNCGISYNYCYTTNEQVNHLSKTEKIYDGASSLVTTTNYYYDDTLNTQPIRVETTNSRNELVKTISRTALEKSDINSASTLTASASAAIDSMISRNMISTALQQEKYVNGNLISRSLINYKNWNDTLLLPETVELKKGSNPSETRVQFIKYDSTGNLSEQKKTGDISHSYIYDYSATYPVAEVINAANTSIAATSFESANTGAWNYAPGGIIPLSQGSITGNKAYNLSFSGIQKTGLDNTQTYIVSCWVKDGSGSMLMNGATATKMVSRRGWSLYQKEVSTITSVSISGNAYIDELRLYPKTAQMVTYTYEPLIGMTSQCDINNKITYYEYDGLGRLQVIRDQDGNIIKTINYNYKQ